MPAKKTVENVNINEEKDMKNMDMENAKLQKTVEELQAKLEQALKMIGNQSSVSTSKKQKLITFINLTPNTVIMQGIQQHILKQQFSQKKILEDEARQIVSRMPNLVAGGYVYIADAEFVEENGLSEAYKDMLTETQLKTLLNKDATTIVEIYKNASTVQKKIIIDMVTEKKINGQAIDSNILMALGQVTNIDFMGMEKLQKEE